MDMTSPLLTHCSLMSKKYTTSGECQIEKDNYDFYFVLSFKDRGRIVNNLYFDRLKMEDSC